MTILDSKIQIVGSNTPERSWLTAEDKDWIIRHNVCNCFGWKMGEGA